MSHWFPNLEVFIFEVHEKFRVSSRTLQPWILPVQFSKGIPMVKYDKSINRSSNRKGQWKCCLFFSANVNRLCFFEENGFNSRFFFTSSLCSEVLCFFLKSWASSMTSRKLGLCQGEDWKSYRYLIYTHAFHRSPGWLDFFQQWETDLLSVSIRIEITSIS